MYSPPSAFSEVRLLCEECNGHFRCRIYFTNHKQSTAKRKSVCERKRFCATCGILVTRENYECTKRFCAHCKQNRDVGKQYYMRLLKDVLPIAGDKVLNIFYDFETTQNTRYSDKATLNVPDLVCLQHL